MPGKQGGDTGSDVTGRKKVPGSIVVSVQNDMVEVIVDSGSVAKVCPPEFGLEFGYTRETGDAEERAVRASQRYGVRDVKCRVQTDSGSWIDAVIEFDVANVAYPVLSMA